MRGINARIAETSSFAQVSLFWDEVLAAAAGHDPGWVWQTLRQVLLDKQRSRGARSGPVSRGCLACAGAERDQALAG